jgi:hypothetical protein
MDWLQFTDSMVGHLAWPIVVLVVLVALRKHLGSLADRVLELGFGGATVKFDRLLSKGREIIAESAPAELDQSEQPMLPPEEGRIPSPEGFSASTTRDVLKLLSRWRGTGAPVDEAFAEIEKVLEEIGQRLDVKARNGLLVRMLITRGLLTSDHLELYNTLRKARDASVHGEFDPTYAQYKEFTFQAAYLFGIFKRALLELQLAEVNKSKSRR